MIIMGNSKTKKAVNSARKKNQARYKKVAEKIKAETGSSMQELASHAKRDDMIQRSDYEALKLSSRRGEELLAVAREERGKATAGQHQAEKNFEAEKKKKRA